MQRINAFFELIKFEHTIFALPFAYLGMVLAAEGCPGWAKFIWITLAMAAARTLAMAANRLVDRKLDARNPRTANRPLVTGKISLKTAWSGTIVSTGLLVLAAWQLGPLTFTLLPGALVFLLGYSYTKRFTWMSHFILGFTDALAPAGAWVAVRGTVFTHSDLPAWLLLGIVTLWIGGFDILYACQDVEVDRRDGLHSIPARFGVRTGLSVSVWIHVLAAGMLIWLGFASGLGWPYWLALAPALAMLAYEHVLVKPDDLSRLGLAFFNMNGYISITLLIGVIAAIATR
jgi:4-hydroxybenzoate polyprenyltransferase